MGKITRPDLKAFFDLGTVARDMAAARWEQAGRKGPMSHAEPDYLLLYGRFVPHPDKGKPDTKHGVTVRKALENLLKTATEAEKERIEALSFTEEQLGYKVRSTFDNQTDAEKDADTQIVLGKIRR